MDQNTVGYSWGDFKMKKGNLSFAIEDKPVFEVPFTCIAQSVIQGKNEVSVEFAEEENADPQLDMLVDMRIWVPEDDKGEGKDGEDEGDETESNTALQRFHKQLIDNADVGGEKGKTLCEFEDWNLAVPRGRYNVKFFANHLAFMGKTFTYKILYKSITKMFLLQTVDFQHHLFILAADPPVRQGRTTYPYVIVQFVSDQRITVNFNLDEATLTEKYGGDLKPALEGEVYNVVGTLFKALTKKKQIIVPGSFKNSRGQPALYCSYKANEGHLYIMEKSLFFLKKPTLYIRNEQITSIEFARLQNTAGSKTMDLVVGVQGADEMHTFSGINRNEYPNIHANFSAKKLPMINVSKNFFTKTGRLTTAGNMNEDEADPYKNVLEDESDEEEEVASSDDADFKAGEAPSTDEDEGDEGDEDLAEEAPTDEEKDDPATEKKSKKRKAPPGEGTPKKDKPKREGRKRAKKDKLAPKKNLNPFMLFSIKNRPTVKSANPKLSTAEIGTKLGEEWAKMDTAAKAEYEEAARVDKIRYLEEMKSYVPPPKGDDEDDAPKGRKRKEKAAGPKRSQSAWQFFVQKKQAELMKSEPSLNFQERGKKVAEMWKNLTSEDKAPFEAAAAEAKTKFVAEKADFEEKSKQAHIQRKEERAKRKEEKRQLKKERRERRKERGEGEDDGERKDGDRKETKEERKKRKAEKKERKRLKREAKLKKAQGQSQEPSQQQSEEQSQQEHPAETRAMSDQEPSEPIKTE